MDPFVLPQELQKFAGPQVAPPAKMMTAKGMAPLQPKDLVTCVFALSQDPDDQVQKAADATIKGFPEGILMTAVKGGLAPQVLDGLVRKVDHQPVIEEICLSTHIHDETLCHLAETGSTRVVDIISNNQTRMLKNPKILDALGNNPLTSPAIIDRIFTFLQQEGAIPDEKSIEEQPELAVDDFVSDDYDLPDDFEFPEDLMEDMQEEMEEESFKNLFGKIANMSIVDKIKMALLGNKEARSILVRDPNKMVSTAVMKSPKIGEDEIVQIARSKNVVDQVLRMINKKKEWRRLYQVQLALAQNPKTPFDIAIGMLKMLRKNDLAKIAKSKSVPNSVATQARRMCATKKN